MAVTSLLRGHDDTAIADCYTPVQFIENPGNKIRGQLAEALNQNAHIPYHVSAKTLYDLPYLVIALDKQQQVVAGSSIRTIHNQVGEFGFTLVTKPYRHRGIAYHMTQLRLNQAKQSGLKIVYAMVRDNNHRSRQNLKKACFRFAGKYLSQYDKCVRLDWYTQNLNPLSRKQRLQMMRPIMAHRISAIY